MHDIKWTVGGGLRYYRAIFHYLLEKKKLYNLDRHLIDSVYDSPHGLIWNGGREPVYSEFCLDDYIAMIKAFNKEGIGFYFTFSNLLIKNKHLSDDFCNYVLENTEDDMNGVIISSDILRNYIRKKYPKFKIKASTCIVDRDYKKLLRKYDIVVLQHGDNYNHDLIKDLKEGIPRMEVLVNETCPPFCPYQKKHQEGISKRNLEKMYIIKHRGVIACYAKVIKTKGEYANVLTVEDVKKLYNLGVRHFKLQGRDLNPQFIIDTMDKYIERPLAETLKNS